jgi:hypothetical protein
MHGSSGSPLCFLPKPKGAISITYNIAYLRNLYCFIKKPVSISNLAERLKAELE